VSGIKTQTAINR